jgi:deoxycitidine kinase/deoxyguanosine kinase
MLYNSKLINHIEYSIYLKWFDEFSDIPLDGIIYVETIPELCVKRVNKRNRKGEDSISLDYLTECHNYHETWIKNTNIRVLYIDGKPEQSIKITEQIKEFVEC